MRVERQTIGSSGGVLCSSWGAEPTSGKSVQSVIVSGLGRAVR